MKTRMKLYGIIFAGISLIGGSLALDACSGGPGLGSGGNASRVYVPPGSYDEFYAFFSGGFSGNVTVHGLPSGRLIKTIPVFSQFPENGYGYTDETRAMLQTTYGILPWDDAHHPELSQTDGVPDGRWLFINGNNTPRIARIDLTTFETDEILQVPNASGNHASPFVTMNTEYIISSTRFSLPIPQKDVPISSYKENFNGTISFITCDPISGAMDVAFQIMVPGYDYDLAHAGKGPSHGWVFLTSYNTEQATSVLEVNASQNDKDFVAAVNWRKAEEYLAEGKFRTMNSEYYHNHMDSDSRIAKSEKRSSVKVLYPEDCPGLIYYLPTPKSPHGVDVDPSGEYICAGGKLSATVQVHSFTKMLKAIENEEFETTVEGIPVLKYESVLAGVVENGGLGPLHTEFDGNGHGYTSMFISSEITKWKLGTWEVVDRIPTYYSIGHLMIPGGDSHKPWGKYVVAINKITKDRYLPTGPELAHAAQLIDITGDKMELLLDFPTMGEPHYAQGIPADLIKNKTVKIFPIEKNTHPYATKSQKDTRVARDGKDVHVYMTTIRTHFSPDNIEGIKVGDNVYFHVTNLEQDWDIPHGFAMIGARTAELLVMPGETRTLTWRPQSPGVYPFYCTDFCSALHQEMQGYVRVSAKNSKTKLSHNGGA
ncbi:MAG: Sec-dependent nitrous-oxide reductase [Candidatus Zixiibacteriota bacterium]